jgi:serine/threonine protein phosphatase 1
MWQIMGSDHRRPNGFARRRHGRAAASHLAGELILPSTDPGDRVYAVGDVHGRFDLLQLLLDRIGEHAAALPPSESLHILFLGDIVDRGPQSFQVMETLHRLETGSDGVVVLLGNHEEAMLQALDGKTDVLRDWMKVGGAATVRSFGLEPFHRGDDAGDYLRRLRAAVPREWVAWLRRLPLTARSGDYLFCHAGIRPGVALRRQTRNDLLWIREDFLGDTRDHGAVIVHGHSVEPQVALRANRIGIDTGAYKTGELTALYLEGDKQEVLSATI